jgi:hypothetical protein
VRGIVYRAVHFIAHDIVHCNVHDVVNCIYGIEQKGLKDKRKVKESQPNDSKDLKMKKKTTDKKDRKRKPQKKTSISS